MPLSAELSRASILGLQALSANVDHDNEWRNKALRSLENASKPLAECEIKVTLGIQRLVEEAK